LELKLEEACLLGYGEREEEEEGKKEDD